jgi:hypothetical protein
LPRRARRRFDRPSAGSAAGSLVVSGFGSARATTL